MTTKIRLKIASIVIIVNLLIGNAILFIGGKISFTKNVNYPLMLGLSIACILIYFLFFRFLNFEKYGKLKLILVSILSCILIIFLGNFLAILIYEPTNEVLSNIPATIVMGFMGNIVMFPISVILGVLNFAIISSLKPKMNTFEF